MKQKKIINYKLIRLRKALKVAEAQLNRWDRESYVLTWYDAERDYDIEKKIDKEDKKKEKK